MAGAGAAVPMLPPRDGALRVEAAWILAFLTAKETETVSELVRVGMVPALVEALVDSNRQVCLYTTVACAPLNRFLDGVDLVITGHERAFTRRELSRSGGGH